MIACTYLANPLLLPTSRTKEVKVKQQQSRIAGEAKWHYKQWVEACLSGYGKKELSSPFEVAGPLTEALLMANLAVRGHDIKRNGPESIKLLWDNANMKVTNFDEVNQFVKREYRTGWQLVF